MPHDESPRQHPSITLAVLAIGGIAYTLLQSMVSPALPEIQEALGTTESAVAWVLTGYLMSAAVFTPIAGRLGDMFGKERVLMIVLVILAFATLLAAVATSIEVLIVARILQGAAGGIFPLAFGIIRDEFPRNRVPGSLGLMSALMGIGAGFGVVLAGIIVDQLGYHFLFWIPLVGVVIAAVMTHFFVPESPIKTPGRINWAGALLMSGGIGGVLLAISQGPTWGWGAPRTIVLFLAGAVLLALWVRNEERAEEPMVDMAMMRIRGVWTTNLVAFLLGIGMFGSFILVPQLVQLPEDTGFGFGSSVTAAGIFLLPSSVAMLVTGALAGRLEARFGSKPPLVAGAIFAMLSFVLLAVAHSTPLEIYLATFLLGAGIGLSFAAMANLIVQNVRQDQTGVATGMNAVTRSLGGAIGGQIVAAILTSSLTAGHPAESGFTIAFVLCAVALLGSVGVAMLIPGRATTPVQSNLTAVAVGEA